MDIINLSIKDMKLPDIENTISGKKQIYLLNFDEELGEFEFVARKIFDLGTPFEEIFVLARTNRQLEELSNLFKFKGIPHVLKTDEINKPVESKTGHVTLSTIHAIKGLEAKIVFVIGCNEQNFPSSGPLVPCGVHLNLLDAYESIHKVKETADIIIPIHDLSVGRHATIPE